MMWLNRTQRRLLFICITWTANVVLLLLYVPLLLTRKLRKRLLPSSRAPTRAKLHVTIHEATAPGRALDTVVLIHGFPDGPPLWRPTITLLTARGHRCINVALPACRGQAVTPGVAPSPDDIVSMLHAALRPIVHDEPVTFIAHDWGAFFVRGFVARFPDLVRRVVLVDVGDVPRDWFVLVCTVSYMTTLSLVFLVGHPLGTRMLQLLFRSVSDHAPRNVHELRADMAWPYFCTFRWLFHILMQRHTIPSKHPSTKLRSSLPRSLSSSTSSPPSSPPKWKSSSRPPHPIIPIPWPDFPSVLPRKDGDRPHKHSLGIPTLFVYGGQKLFPYHSPQYERHVAMTPEGRVHRLECGHWVPTERPAEWLAILQPWLDRTSPRPIVDVRVESGSSVAVPH